MILVAHDRWFLEAVTTATMEVVAGRGTFFPGPWHAWRREKAARALHAQKETQRIAGDIERLERFVERFRAKKDKAKQAQAKVTQIQRLESERKQAADEVALLSRRTRTLGFEFLKPARSGRTVLEVEGLDVRIGERQLLRGRDLCARARRARCARRTERLRQDDAPRDACSGAVSAAKGKIQLGHGVVPAYFSQQEAELDTRGSVLQCVQSMTNLARPDAMNASRALSLLGLGRGREAGERALGR